MRASECLRLLLEVYDAEYAKSRNFDPHVSNLSATFDSVEDMMAAFDELPGSIRDILKKFPLKFSAVETLKHFQHYGEQATLDLLHDGLSDASSKLTVDAYGDDHPQSSGWDLDDVEIESW